MNTKGRVDLEMTENVESWLHCSRLCLKRKDCKFWTFHFTGGTHDNQCRTMSDISDTGGDWVAMSGARECQGET